MVLGVTLAASIAAGFAWSRANDDGSDLDASLDTPGTYVEPSPGIPTAPQLAGDPLPDVAVTDLDGNEVRFADLIGQPMVVNIWFSTCVPCKTEMPAFGQVQGELGDDVRFIGLNYSESADVASSFASDHGARYEQLLDAEGDFTSALQIGNFPATLFVDATGRIVELHQGALDADTLTATIRKDLLP